MRQLTANQAIDFTRRVETMLADPDLTGDQLLIAMAMSHFFGSRDGEDAKFSDVMDLTGWDRPRLIRALRDDAPRYTPDRSQASVCANPMIRRDGPCGKRAWNDLPFRDPDTGEVTQRGACSRHWPELQSQHRTNRADWLAAGSPMPGPNTGGVLPRYFEGDWLKLYKNVGAWGLGDTLPEVPVSFPKLTALATDGPPETSAPVRPALSVVRD